MQAERYYDYHLETGPVAVEADTARGFLFRGASLLALERERLEGEEARQDAKRLMRAALKLYLGGKTLKSRELFRTGKNRRT